MTALVIGVVRPEWSQRVWEASGIGCGRDLSPGDPENLDSPWAAWGEGDHDLVESLDPEEHRENVEAMAEELGYEPVAEIPRHTRIEDGDGQSLDAEVTVRVRGEQLRMDLSLRREEPAVNPPELYQVAALAPTTGETAWHWDLQDGNDVQVHDHGEHLVIANEIPSFESFFDTDRLELVGLHQSTGEQEGCQRFDGGQTYGSSDGDTGLLASHSDTAEEDERVAFVSTVQQVALPDISEGFTKGFPDIESMDHDGPSRPQPMSILDETVYIAYSFDFESDVYDALNASYYPHIDFTSDQIPVEAFSMDTGEKLWDIGEPGDQIAFITAVDEAPGDGTGVLAAEFGDVTPLEDDPERSNAPVTLQMYNSRGDLIWELPTQDSKGILDSTGSAVAVLDDVMLARTGPDEITAVDIGTGEELWRLDESDEDQRAVSLEDAITVDGMIYLPGSRKSYLLDPRTGENHAQMAEAAAQAGVSSSSPLGEEVLLVETLHYGYSILQRQED